jgi:glutathione S-transferase
MKLYGTTTSPYVRRTRVVAAELGVPVQLIDTATDEGQARLREITPIRKVPVAVVDGKQLFDSRVIIDWLVTTRGYGTLSTPRDRWRDHNLVNAIDGALDSIIQLFYLRRDGIAIDGTPYATRQLERTAAILEWLSNELVAPGDSFDGGFGLAELSTICALDWMDFRKVYETERATGLAALRAQWRDRPSLVDTRPHA